MHENSDPPLILVAEGHGPMRRLLARCLSSLSERVVEADTAEAALALAAREAPALIALDPSLDGGPDGAGLCRAVRRAAAGPTRIIVNTMAGHPVSAKISFLRAGADTYYPKDEPVRGFMDAARHLLLPGPVSGLPRRPTALIVEDDKELLRGLSRMLSRGGFEVRTATSVPLAVLHALEARPDAVLLDFGLPRMDGLEGLRILRSLPGLERTAVWMLTGEIDEALEALCRREGLAGWLLKRPRGWYALVERVRASVRQRSFWREAGAVLESRRRASAPGDAAPLTSTVSPST